MINPKNGARSFSIVICTHNREKYLVDAVKSLWKQDYPVDKYEIVIVDNASVDNTRQVAERFRVRKGPRLRYIYEPELGLSLARNTGMKASDGEIVAYLDDDADAEHTWLAALNEAYESSDNVLCVGGKIRLAWNSERPLWFPSELEGYLGSTATPLGNKKRVLIEGEYPFGGNISVCRKTLLKVGGFSVSFGRKGKSLLSSEEAELCNRIRLLGGIVLYEPAAVVHHRVLPERVSRSYMLRRAYWQGISDALLEESETSLSRTTLVRQILASVRNISFDAFRSLSSLVRGKEADCFLAFFNLVSQLGRTGHKFRRICKL
jgi:glycosyltransferase involved in cell wall biosynthesis